MAKPARRYSFMTGVSCPSATACIAVGRTTNDAYIVARHPGSVCISPPSNCSGPSAASVAESWNGRSWKLMRIPQPGSYVVPYGVSCVSARMCVAVGYWNTPSRSGGLVAQGSLAVIWNGHKWRLTHVPKKPDLLGVSCPSTKACVAVGDGPRTEFWDGHKWTPRPVPKPRGAKNVRLYGVSCTAANSCVAVGYSRNSAGRTLSLAERWNGTSWMIQPTPNPSGAIVTTLFGVSCTSANSCASVGSAAPQTLAEQYLAPG